MALVQNFSNSMTERESDALNRYVVELVRLYPSAAEQYRVDPSEDEEVWIALGEAMATVATDLVVETGCLFVLTTLD